MRVSKLPCSISLPLWYPLAFALNKIWYKFSLIIAHFHALLNFAFKAL